MKENQEAGGSFKLPIKTQEGYLVKNMRKNVEKNPN